MKRKLKAILSVVLCCSLVLTSVLCIRIVSAAASVEYFTDGSENRTGIKLVKTDDGKTYYAVGDGSALVDSSGNDYEFYKTVLTEEYNGVSPVNHWANVASAIFKNLGNNIGYKTPSVLYDFDELFASNASTGDFILTDALSSESATTEGNVSSTSSSYMNSTGLAYYTSLNSLQDAMATEINKLSTNLTANDNGTIIKNATGKDSGFDYINSAERKTVLGVIATGNNYDSISMTSAVSSFGLAFYDFNVVPFVEDGIEFVTAAEGYDSIKSAAENNAPDVKYVSSSEGMGYTSYTTNPSLSESNVSVSFSETSSESVSNSMESSNSYTYTAGTEASTSLSVSIPGIVDSESSVSFNFSTSETIGTAYGTSKELTKSTTTSSTADVVLPAHTKIGITQQPGNVEMIFDYDCPVYITYKVAVFGMNGMITSGILLTNSLGSMCTVFGGETTEDGITATENLYNRAVNKKDILGFEKTQKTFTYETDNKPMSYIDWTAVSQASPANGFGKVSDSVEWLNNNTPISAAGATMSLLSTGVKTSITGIEPLYDLDNVRIDGTGTYNLAIGGSLDLATVMTQGYNQYNIPYYGYISLNGEWNICDADGNILSSVDGISLDFVSDYQVLTAETLGEYYIKYSINENAYKNIDGNYISNSDLTSTPIIKICVTKTGENHTCTPGEWKTTIPATCFIEGEQVQSCSVCGLAMNIQKLEKLAHTPVRITTPETCTADGSITEICGICNATISSSIISATGHDEGTWKIDFEATADHNGQMSRYCAKCDELLESKEFELHTHEFGYESITREPTCTQNGEKSLFCSVCGAAYATEQIEKSGHGDTYAVTTILPTCISVGEKTVYCLDCHEAVGTQEIAKTGHDNGVWKVDFEATADHDGQMTRYCSICNAALESKTFELHEHSYSSWKTNNDGTHSRDCYKCGFTESANCNYVATVTASTCTEGGHTTYVCADCKHTYIDDYTNAIGHDWSKWTADATGETHSRVCKREGCLAEETGSHEWSEWKYNEDGKAFCNGTKSRECAHCGHSETDEAQHTSWFGQIFYPIIVFIGNIVHKLIYIISLNWLFPELTITPKI